MTKVDIAGTTFYEKINLTKLNYIINTLSQYDKIIKEEEKLMRIKDYSVEVILSKIKETVCVPSIFEDTEFAYLPVTYRKGKFSNGIGRWYCNKSIGIQMLTTSVRSTICDGIWKDIDQVNSHPTILKNLFEKIGESSPLLNKYVDDREKVLEKIMKENKCTRDQAKNRVIEVINGSECKGGFLEAFKDEIMPFIQKVIELGEYAKIYNSIIESGAKNPIGKAIAQILQVIENDMLECYEDYSMEKGLIPKYNDGYETSLIFDGFQLLDNDEIDDDFLEECRVYALEKTGYDVELKVKPFQNSLALPEDYADRGDDEVGLVIDKFVNGVDDYMAKNKAFIIKCLGDKGAHASLSALCKNMIKDALVYDDDIDMWFHCDTNNIWTKRKGPIVIQSFIKKVLNSLFLKMGEIIKKSIKPEMDEEDVSAIQKRVKCAQDIALKLLNASYIKHITDLCKIDFAKNCFYEKKIDSFGHLFAFSDKVFDCRTKEMRKIKPSDYIMNNTQYKFPNEMNTEAKLTLENYYKTIYPDPDVCDYMWDSDSLLLNGERIFQTFMIHSGSGCNSKSTKFVVIKKMLGDYFIQMNPETFTKAPKGANATSELYLAKGRRMVFFNEPESDADNKLQVGLMKTLADGFKANLKTRGLYKDATEFPIFFRVEGACNNKPPLSSVDGGAGRRVRVVDWVTKFVENPDPNNPHQAKLDNEMVSKLCTDTIRDTYILMLIDRFKTVSSLAKFENIPKKIIDDSIDYITDSNTVLGFIMDKFIITGDDTNRMSSSDLIGRFKKATGSRMEPGKFKTDMLGISGITFKKSSGQYFCGLLYKPPDEVKDVPDDDDDDVKKPKPTFVKDEDDHTN